MSMAPAEATSAVRTTQMLPAIHEVDFVPCSYGYRPGLSAPEAIKDLTEELQWRGHELVVKAGIKGFFDDMRWAWMEPMLEQRIGDGALLNLIGKWLRGGILEEDGRVIHPQSGTPAWWITSGLGPAGGRMRERIAMKSPVPGIPPAGICEGGAAQPASPPRRQRAFAKFMDPMRVQCWRSGLPVNLALPYGRGSVVTAIGPEPRA